MKEDIQFYKARDVFIAAIKEWDEDFTSQQWNVYLINNREEAINTVLVLSRGKSDTRKTSTLRHSLGDVLPKTVVKIEFIATEVLGFTNEFLLTFFVGTDLYERNYTFGPGTISEEEIRPLPILEYDGILAK